MPTDFTLASLENLGDGRVAIAFDKAFETIIRDCQDRPHLDKPRKVTFTVSASPITDGGGASSVCVTCKIAESVPPRESPTYTCGVRPNGTAFFSSDPNSPFQAELNGLEDND